ncbi:uncharacterized protein K02A2.6-like [Toxorhynchites rutilus septentrionalis]|uniref:uncharacterized protein K02A2.6-like n=1 Tax=Toxorhynchites rutilus septentrionalis TaxID=329112 RepID=UPI00247A450D|nr:uncharacterized protein K02A2.6-like [Toxorhynchites rutilus septentrionalis]
MDAQVEKFVKSCRGCTLVSAPEPPEPLQRSKLPSSPWHTIALDFFGPLPEGQHLMVVIDYYSRFMEVCEMETITAYDTHEHNPLLATIGEVNGEVERQNRSIVKRLRIAQQLGQDWRHELYLYLLTYHSSKHPTTGESPGELMFGRRIKSKLPVISSFQEDAEARDRDAVVKEKGKEYTDRRRGAKESDLEQGDHVLVKRMRKSSKLDADYNSEEFVICRKTGTDSIIQSRDTGKLYRRSSAHLKKIRNRHETPEDGEIEQDNLDSSMEANFPSTEPIKDPESVQSLSGVTKRIRLPPAKYADYAPH